MKLFPSISRSVTALVAGFVAVQCARADITNTIPASANAYVLRSDTSGDQSETQSLATKRLNDSNTRISYVRFNVSSFLSNYPIANITSARLRLYFVGGAADSVKVWGLNNVNANGISDGAWTGSMTWNTQPARTSSPDDIPNSATALPNANTTAQLGSQSYGTTADEVDISLNVATLQSLLLADNNAQITLLFCNNGSTTPGWASLSNTNAFLVPTLELVVVSPQTLTWDGTVNGNWSTNTANWKGGATYRQADFVRFDDTASGTNFVTMAASIQPGSVTVSNSAINYTLNGGSIVGSSPLTKQGAGTLNLSSNAATFGTVTIEQGAVNISGGTFGASSIVSGNGGGTLTVSGATLTASGSIAASGAALAGLLLTNATLYLPANSNAPTAFTTNLTTSGSNTINVTSVTPGVFASYPYQMRLLDYSTLVGAGFNFTPGFLPGSFQGYLTNNAASTSIDLVLTSGPTMPAGPVTNSISASANAYVYRANASSDQSEAQTLVTKQLDNSSTRIAYARFNVAAFLSNYPIANISSAKLKIYFTGGTGDQVKVYGLQNNNLNGVSDGAWTENMTWNNQPAKTASPNDIGGSASALPNANTTPLLGSTGFSSSAGVVSITLDLVQMQALLVNDANQQITLLFHNTGDNTVGWASIANTSGNPIPTLDIVATPPSAPMRSLVWFGGVNGNWDTNFVANWKTNAASPTTTYFNQADNVTFDDTLTGTSDVNLATTLSPTSVVVSNATVNYTFSGSGKISGITGIVKKGAGNLTINTANDFNGSVYVSGGTVKPGSASAFGSAISGTFVTNAATLDVSGVSLASEPVSVSGAGVGGNGVVINTGASQTSALRDVTLLGDATFGGTGRWDIRNTGGNASLDTLGQPRKLIKVGANQLSLVAVSVDSKLGDIDVRQGILSVETSTSGLGNPNNTLSVSNGASLQLYQNSVELNKKVSLAAGATFFNSSGANRFSGAITLLGNATINVGGTSLTLNDGIGGAGGLIKTGSSPLIVNGTSSYTGGTTLSAGRLKLNGDIGGPLTAASGTTLAGTFNNNGTATVGGTLLPGDNNMPGTIGASGLTLNSGATVTFELFPAAGDLLQVNGDLTLNNNSVTILPLATLQTNVPYRLVNYTGTRSGTFNPALNLAAGFAASLDYSTPGQVNAIFSQVQTFTIPTQYPTGPGPMNITLGPDGKLVYHPDANGDTIPDFSKAGYMGGEEPIPDVPVVMNLSPVAGNNYTQIQDAINTLKTWPLGTNGLRGAILLAPGIYEGSGTVTVNGGGIVLRGSGEGTNGTILRGMSLSISGGSRSLGSTKYTVTSDYVPVGAKWFTVNSVSGLAVGDEIKITRPSNGTWLDDVYPPGGKDSWVGAIDNTLYRKITAIEQNRVMIDAPLVISYDNIHGYGGAYFYKATYSGTQHSGIEYLRVDRGNSTPDTNGNTGGVMMDFGGVQNCWVRHLYNDRMNGHTMDVGGARYITIQDVTSFHLPLIYRESSATVQNFTFSYGGQGLLFHRCVTSYGGSEFTSGPAGSGPTVFSECTIPAAVAFTGPHMKFTCGVLYDAIYANQGFQTFKNDGSHGYGGANHLAWNCEASSYHFDRPPTAHQWNIGCIGTVSANEPRSGALPCERLSQGKHVEPGSLFRAQLAERIGQERAYAVLGHPDGANPYTLVALPETNSVAPGQNVSCPILMAVPPDYGGQTVTFSFSGLPAGVSASFGTATRNSGGTNFLNVVASNSAPVGTYLITIKGSGTFPVRGGGSALTTRTITMKLKVTGPNNFLLAAEPYYQAVDPGTNTSFTVTVTGTNGFSGNVALGVLGLPFGVGASFDPPGVTGSGESTLTLTASNTVPSGTYTLTLVGTNSGLVSGATVKIGLALSGALPEPWQNADIGSHTNKGSATFTNSAFNIRGSGADIWGTADQFQFTYVEETGDLTLTARVASQSNTDPWAKAGVMIRESTNANAKFVGLYVTPTASHGVSLQSRSTTGGSAVDNSQVNGPTVPHWLRLVRAANTFKAYRSSDGQTWTQVGSDLSITMSAGMVVGLAVCSHNTTALSTATFDNVSIVYPDFELAAGPTPQIISPGEDGVFTVTVTGTNGFSGTVGLRVDGLPAGVNANFAPAAIATSGSSTLTIATLATTPPGGYDLTITATNGALVHEEIVTLEIVSPDSDGDGIPDWWTQQYFGHPTGEAGDLSRAEDDADGDRMSNLTEYLCGSNPTNAASYLHVTVVTRDGDDVRVRWQAVEGRNYYIEAAVSLADPGSFTVVSPLLTPSAPGESEMEFIHTGGVGQVGFYRVRLEP